MELTWACGICGRQWDDEPSINDHPDCAAALDVRDERRKRYGEWMGGLSLWDENDRQYDPVTGEVIWEPDGVDVEAIDAEVMRQRTVFVPRT